MRYVFIVVMILSVASCSLALKIKSGDMAYQLKHYQTAADFYEEEYNTANGANTKRLKAKKTARSYEQLNDFESAFKWYERSYSRDANADDLVRIANAAAAIDSVELAMRMFKQIYKVTNDRNFLNRAGILQQLDYDENAWDVKSINTNTEFSDYCPVAYGTTHFVFTSDRPSNYSDAINTYTGREQADIYIASQSNFDEYLFDTPVNSIYADGTPTFNPTYDEVYFTRCQAIEERDVHCRIYYSVKINNTWREPKPIMFFEERVNVGQPAYMDADSLLIFSTRLQDNYQLYYSQKQEDGWSTPELMPESLLSPYDEKFPVIVADTLYFASNRITGYGGLDLYKSYLNAEGYWTTPKLLTPPYNSAADDFGYMPMSKSKSVLITSNRARGNGLDDIYQITKLKTIEKTDEPTADKTANIYVAIRTLDADTQNPISAQLTFFDTNTESKVVETNTKGQYINQISNLSTDRVVVTKKGYLTETKLLSFPLNVSRDTTVNLTIRLQPIRLGEEIVLEDIYYDYDSYAIRDDAKPSLDSLYTLLSTNPNLTIELGSHTDCRGDDEYNLQLSNNRALSAVNYLKSKGIAPSRLSHRGYGESSPSVNCICEYCTEDEHQTNRRTSFKIISY